MPTGARADGVAARVARTEALEQHLRLSHPGLDFWVDVRVRGFEGRWLATPDLAEDRPDVGSGESRREAIRAALRALDEPYASEMAESVTLDD